MKKFTLGLSAFALVFALVGAGCTGPSAEEQAMMEENEAAAAALREALNKGSDSGDSMEAEVSADVDVQ